MTNYHSRIKIKRLVSTRVNGEAAETFQDVCNVWASVEIKRGSRIVADGIVAQTADYIVKTRWAKAVAAVQMNDVIILASGVQLRVMAPPREDPFQSEILLDAQFSDPVGLPA